MFDDAKARIYNAIHAGDADPRELCHLLDRASRGFLTKADFEASDHSWSSRFGLVASDISDLGWVLDFGADDRLAYGDFVEQLQESDYVANYGRSRRRTGPTEFAVSGPELEVTHSELADTLREHEINADQIALDLGAAFDVFIPWERIFEAMVDMGLRLNGPQARSLARINGTRGGTERGLTLREFDAAFPTAPRDVGAPDQEHVDEVISAMNLYGLDFREDVFMGAERVPSAAFRRKMCALLGPEVSNGAINALTLLVALGTEDMKGEDGSSMSPRAHQPYRLGEIHLKALQRRCAYGKTDRAECFARATREPLSTSLLRRAVDAAAASDGICELPHQGLTDSSVEQWLHSSSASNLRPRGLSDAGALVELDLSSNRIGCSGATAIARRLDGDRSLQRLSLANNRIGDAGAQSLALLIQGSQTLRLVDLAHNAIGERGVAALRRARAANPTNIVQLVFTESHDHRTANSPGPANAAISQSVQQKPKVPRTQAQTKLLPRSGAACTRPTLITTVSLGRRQQVQQ
jgi:hypothetical protein